MCPIGGFLRRWRLINSFPLVLLVLQITSPSTTYSTRRNPTQQKHTKTYKNFFLATNEWCASDFFMELSPFCAAQFLKLIPLLFNPHWENWIGLVWRNCHRIPMHLMVNKDGFMQLVFQNDYAFEREHIRSSSYLPAFRYLWSPASWW